LRTSWWHHELSTISATWFASIPMYDQRDPLMVGRRGGKPMRQHSSWIRGQPGLLDYKSPKLFRENWLSELLVHYTVSPAWWRRDGRRRICDLPRHPAGQTKGHS